MKTENSFLSIHLYFDHIQRSSSGTTLYSKKHSLSHEDSETAFSTPSTVKSVFIARIRVFYFFFLFRHSHYKQSSAYI